MRVDVELGRGAARGPGVVFQPLAGLVEIVGCELRPVLAERAADAVLVELQRVAQMRGVLERGPGAGLGPGSHG